MILSTLRYASNSLSKNPSIYRPAVRPKVLHSRFTSTNSETLFTMKWYRFVFFRCILGGSVFGVAFATGECLITSYLKLGKAMQNTKEAIQDVKAHVKDTKDEVKGIIEDTRDDHHEMADRLVDLAKEKKRKWQARKDAHPKSEDETSD